MTASEIELSVVIPAYNEAGRLPATLRKIEAYLSPRGVPYQIVVVDDGSKDGTAEIARQTLADKLTVLQNEGNRGKGYSVRRGMLAARGARRLMSDADLSTPIEELARLEQALAAGADVVIGSRAVAGAKIEVHQPLYRESMGRLFNLLVRLLLVPSLHDTQCGFKLFSREAALSTFSRARLDGFSFDVEVLFIATRQRLRIVELPVTWRNDAASRVTLLRGVLAFADLLRIRANGVAGRYRG